MDATVKTLEAQLNSPEPAKRKAALLELADFAAKDQVALPEPGRILNLHCHTTYSFNGYGYTPTYLAWIARCDGQIASGIVDFDVLDAVDEFLEAARIIGIRAVAGIETRVFVPAYADKVMNSPGEPGVAYFMGVGFTSKASADQETLDDLKEIAQRRTLTLLERVNPHLGPVALDYETEVLALTPAGNPTERHLCLAYEKKAREVFTDEDELVAFWMEKLDASEADVRKALASSPDMQGLIRSKTMKKGGVGYMPASGPDFPSIDKVAKLALDAGAIPAYAFLDGSTDGEADMGALLDEAAKHGAAALNIIPDRNWNFKDVNERKKKAMLFHKCVQLARERDLPIIVGTEMNAYGQKLVDDFEVPEMAEVADEFVRGAMILHAHTLLQGHAGMGYLSKWAMSSFSSTSAKNEFYAIFGEQAAPERADYLVAEIDAGMTPSDILAHIGRA